MRHLPARPGLFALTGLFFVLSLGLAAAETGASVLAQGERLFRENQPEAALPFLEQATREPTAEARTWLWLSVAYQQLGRLDEAVGTLRKGLARATSDKQLFYFNLGNLFLLQGKASFARDMFDSAIAAEASFAPAWLNRANSAMMLEDLRAAKADYQRYLVLEPASSQRANIEALILRLDGAVAEADRLKAAAEAARVAEELARKSLLDEVSASLKAAAEETTNMAAGSGQVQGYGDELPVSD